MRIKIQRISALLLVLGVLLSLCGCTEKRERRRAKARETTQTEAPETTAVTEPEETEDTQEVPYYEELVGEWSYTDGDVVLFLDGMDAFTLSDFSDLDDVRVTTGVFFYDGVDIYLDTDSGERMIATLQEDGTIAFYEEFSGLFYRPGEFPTEPAEPEDISPWLDGEWKHESQNVTLYFAGGSYFEYTELNDRETAFMIDGGCRYEDGLIVMETDTHTILRAYIDDDGYLHLYGMEGRFCRTDD